MTFRLARSHSLITTLGLTLALLFQGVLPAPAQAEEAKMLPGTRVVASAQGFDEVVQRLEKSIADNQMGLVAQASASRGAAGRGVKIAGNTVLMVFRNDFAVRMLKASIPAGIEAPLRLYVTENPAGGSRISYLPPSVVFAPYGNAELDAMARELDPIFERIVADATRR
ncbi:MAG: DUF302 domain-containing protein [Polaromonas sp.]